MEKNHHKRLIWRKSSFYFNLPLLDIFSLVLCLLNVTFRLSETSVKLSDSLARIGELDELLEKSKKEYEDAQELNEKKAQQLEKLNKMLEEVLFFHLFLIYGCSSRVLIRNNKKRLFKASRRKHKPYLIRFEMSVFLL